jgi:hypothetical protein
MLAAQSSNNFSLNWGYTPSFFYNIEVNVASIKDCLEVKFILNSLDEIA